MNRLSGILPVLPTPFTPAGNVDSDAMARLVAFAKTAGAPGVVFPGFASEVEHLSPDERAGLLQVVVEAADRLQVVAGASGQSAAEVIENGLMAARLGVSWLMIQPPKDILGAAQVTTFFREITRAVPDARIVLQNAPAPRGSDLSPDTILAVLQATPQIAYVKEETLPAGPAITAILGKAPESLLGVIGGGGARYILDEYARGACAAMPALELVKLHVDLDAAWRRGDRQAARALYVQCLPLLTLQAVYRMRLTKYVLARLGILTDTSVRAKTPAIDAMAAADIDQNLAELGLWTPEEAAAHA